MLSKFVRNSYRSNASLLLVRKLPPTIVNARYVDLIPPTHYDTPFPKKMKIRNLLRDNWEVTPLIICVCMSMCITLFHIYWALTQKVDVQYKAGSRSCISRDMDLRNPTQHKIFNINQNYDPWPEMQDVLDKMTVAERRALMRAKSCSQA